MNILGLKRCLLRMQLLPKTGNAGGEVETEILLNKEKLHIIFGFWFILLWLYFITDLITFSECVKLL